MDRDPVAQLPTSLLFFLYLFPWRLAKRLAPPPEALMNRRWMEMVGHRTWRLMEEVTRPGEVTIPVELGPVAVPRFGAVSLFRL